MGNIHQKVALRGARFFAFHGLYEEEQLIGSEFIVDVETEMEVFNDGNDDIANTINYEQLYYIVSVHMKDRRDLLESVAHAILEHIRHDFHSVKNIRVCIRKMHPLLDGEVESSQVELAFSR